jgi:protein transport protein SEC13
MQVFISPGTLHSASINSVAFAPHELGLILAAASSDGTVSVIEYSAATGAWETTKVSRIGVLGVK